MTLGAFEQGHLEVSTHFASSVSFLNLSLDLKYLLILQYILRLQQIEQMQLSRLSFSSSSGRDHPTSQIETGTGSYAKTFFSDWVFSFFYKLSVDMHSTKRPCKSLLSCKIFIRTVPLRANPGYPSNISGEYSCCQLFQNDSLSLLVKLTLSRLLERGTSGSVQPELSELQEKIELKKCIPKAGCFGNSRYDRKLWMRG